MGHHSATAQATSSWEQGVILGQQHRGLGGKPGCPKTRAPQSQSKQLPVPAQFGATSWVQGRQGQCGCGQGWPWGWHQPGNLCALSRGLRGQGASATSGPPSSSCCNGDSDVRPCSDVPIPHSPAGAPAGASVPLLGVLRTGFGLTPFGKGLGCHCVLSHQCPPASTQLALGAVGPATTVASEQLPPLLAAMQCAGTRCPCVPCQPCCWTTRSVRQRDLDLPWGSCCFPILSLCWLPSDAIPTIPFLQDTGSPKTLPAFLGGSLACTPNYLRPWGRGAAWESQWGPGDSSTALGQIHLSLLYLSQAWVEGPCGVPSDSSW